jgi:hypothetical protein
MSKCRQSRCVCGAYYRYCTWLFVENFLEVLTVDFGFAQKFSKSSSPLTAIWLYLSRLLLPRVVSPSPVRGLFSFYI